jgi:phospholipase/carboxylesterase
VLIAAGRHDPIAGPRQTQELADLLTRTGAEVTVHWSVAGHNLTRDDLQAGARWMSEVSTAF